MEKIDYSKLSRPQKLAVFLIAIGPESAAEVLRQFEDTEVEMLCREMSQLPMISARVRTQVLEEFSPLVTTSASSALGGFSYAHRTLSLAKGDYKASSILGRVGPVGTSVDAVKDISDMEGRQIFNLIKHEQPQTISFVLSYLDSGKASEVFSLLTIELREEVIERLGTIESTSLDLVGKIVRNLGKHFDTKEQPSFHRSGGVGSVADLLNKMDKSESKTLLARLEERNSQLGQAVRKKMFSFEDIGRLMNADLQLILREVDSSNLAIAMKSASESLREKFYGAISKRAAESLREEIEFLGQVRMKDVEIAQDAIIQVVRRLEDEDQITVDADSETQMA